MRLRLRDLIHISVLAWADKNGGPDDVALRRATGAGGGSVVEGRIDAAVLGTPYLTQAVEDGTVRIFAKPYDAVSTRFIHIAWFTLEDYAAKNRDVVERFARVMHDAAVYCNAHQAETVPLIAEFGKVDPKIAARMTRVTFPEYLSGPLIQPLVDVTAKYKAIEKPFDAQELISPYALKPPR